MNPLIDQTNRNQPNPNQPDWAQSALPTTVYEQRLRNPSGLCHVVIDSDAANEIDDQFALAWALLRQDRLKIHGIYATPFSFAHRRNQYPDAPDSAPPFNPPDIGMQRSYDEILTIQRLIRTEQEVPTFLGSTSYLRSLDKPQGSPATQHLIDIAMSMPNDEPLYVVAVGCLTNIANALLIEPRIREKIVVVWTAAYPSHAPHINRSFNLEQDLLASRLIFDCGVPLVYLPGFHVGVQLRLSFAECEQYILPQGELGAYLHQLFTNNPLWAMMGRPRDSRYTWVIWDLINLAWLIEPAWVPTHLVRTPSLDAELRWQHQYNSHPMREGFGLDRDAIYADLFQCFERNARN